MQASQGLDFIKPDDQLRAGTKNDKVQVKYYEFGQHCSPGMRRNMEDYADYYVDGEYQAFAVYDGHGGKFVAEHCSKNFLKHLVDKVKTSDSYIEESLKSAYAAFNEGILNISDWDDVGACAVTALIKFLPDGERLLMLANCGDSYAVLACRSPSGKGCVGLSMSKEHIPSDPGEIERVSRLGGTCAGGRLWGGYAHVGVSRSMGDNAFVNGDNGLGMTCEPAVFTKRITPDDLFLVLGSDGLMVRGSLEQEEVIQYVYQQLKTGSSAQQASVDVVRCALSRGSCDNISAVVIKFAQNMP